ncbi:MAG: carboxypeptidase regulatory-like domain-containing protein [Caldilineaceae bacterium]|nr:carboxypeptidase regulatory-like domain-containing protein [Caldilineaceae bacterium]
MQRFVIFFCSQQRFQAHTEMIQPRLGPRLGARREWRWLVVCLLLLSACAPTPEGNVLGYWVAQRLGRFDAPPPVTHGSLQGYVMTAAATPLVGATVILAERNGLPHSAQTDSQGRYQIDQIPPGQYVVAALAPYFQETTLQDKLGWPLLLTIQPAQVTTAPPITLARHQATPLPEPLAASTQLTLTGTAIVTAAFPIGSQAQVQAFQFTYADAVVSTLRLYLPTTIPLAPDLPLLFMVYPTLVDAWQSVSTAMAAQGFAVVAISPVAERALAIDAHALDARIALALAQRGDLDPRLEGKPAVALGGSFSSAILHRFLRDTNEAVAAWVTVGGITDAFRGTAAFYAGRIEIPPDYTYLIPALGPPNLYPLAFLRYSPIYTAAQLPPTLIIHTAADRIIPISQAYELEAALRQAGVPVTVFYYEDSSHYLQIDDQMTDAGREMFYRVITFAKQYRD